MPLGKPDVLARLRNAYETLSSSAQSLNNTSEELSRIGAAMDAAVKKLNLGVEAWATIASYSDEDQPHLEYVERLGYAKINGRWGLAIRVVVCDRQEDDETIQQEWLFADAPREKRIMAIDRLPELIDALNKNVRSLHDRMSRKITEARGILEVLNQSAESAEGKE